MIAIFDIRRVGGFETETFRATSSPTRDGRYLNAERSRALRKAGHMPGAQTCYCLTCQLVNRQSGKPG